MAYRGRQLGRQGWRRGGGGQGAPLVLERHAGQVPHDRAALEALPGVGRKTANVVLGNAFNKSEGVVVDTHVTRVANRLDLTDHATDAVKIEQDLMQIVPRDEWTLFSHLLIHHGLKIPEQGLTVVLAGKPREQHLLEGVQRHDLVAQIDH